MHRPDETPRANEPVLVSPFLNVYTPWPLAWPSFQLPAYTSPPAKWPPVDDLLGFHRDVMQRTGDDRDLDLFSSTCFNDLDKAYRKKKCAAASAGAVCVDDGAEVQDAIDAAEEEQLLAQLEVEGGGTDEVDPDADGVSVDDDEAALLASDACPR